MIVNKLTNGYEIIFQRAHGLLAGKIANEIASEFRPDHRRWLETLASIIEHDDGQRKWSQKEFLDESGHPEDFTEQDIDLAQARAVVNTARYKSHWMALLTSLHTTSLYQPFKHRENVQRFLNDQLIFQKQLFREFGITKHEAQKAYKFLRWCDELSLLLCKNLLPDSTNTQCIGELPSGTPRYIGYNNHLYITPWCFTKESIFLDVESYHVEKKQFTTETELQQYIENELPKVKKWTIKKL